MRFPSSCKVGEVHKNHALAKQCYLVACQAKPLNAFPIKGLYTRDELAEETGKSMEDLIVIPLHDGNPQHVVRTGSKLDEAIKQQLVAF